MRKRFFRDMLLPGFNLMDLYLIGDCPNKEMKTMGGNIFWDEIMTAPNGWKLQRHRFTNLCRILDKDSIRKAWGNRFAMEEKFKRLTRKEFLEIGDVIGIDRMGGIYEHFAIYIGNDRVIHYQGENGDFADPTIHEDPFSKFINEEGDPISRFINKHEFPFSEFLKEDEKYFVLLFDEEHENVIKLRPTTQFMKAEVMERNSLFSIFNDEDFHLYSARQTITRARKRLGEDEYKLLRQNCEHFAVWCKTGVSCSFQVKKVITWPEIIKALKPSKILD